MNINKPSHSKLIFVVGVWRSGTSLLYALLHNHPRIALMYEAEVFGLFPTKPGYIFPQNWVNRLEFFNQAISRHQLTLAPLPKSLSARESTLALFNAWAARKNAPVMGEKLVAGHAQLEQFAHFFPEADFIVIWRDPLETCRSVVSAGQHNRFFSRKGMLTRTLFGSEQLAKGVLKLRAAGRRVHEVVYQELVEDPEFELRKACSFLGVEFDPQMVNLESADCSMLPPGNHHASVRSGVVNAKRRQQEILSAEFVAKGTRYAALWRERYPGLAFARALPAQPDARKPGWLEQMADREIYRGWSWISDFKRLLCRRMPLPVWQCWRSAKMPATVKKAAASSAEKSA